MFFTDRNRDTTPDLCELLAMARAGHIFEPEPDDDPIYTISDTEFEDEEEDE